MTKQTTIVVIGSLRVNTRAFNIFSYYLFKFFGFDIAIDNEDMQKNSFLIKYNHHENMPI